MRSFVTIMIMLFLFTATQVAASFEHCDEPACSDYSGGVQKKGDDTQKKDGLVTHCAIGCHHITAIPQQALLAVRAATQSASVWAEPLMPDSAIGESLIEPPTLA